MILEVWPSYPAQKKSTFVYNLSHVVMCSAQTPILKTFIINTLNLAKRCCITGQWASFFIHNFKHLKFLHFLHFTIYLALYKAVFR